MQSETKFSPTKYPRILFFFFLTKCFSNNFFLGLNFVSDYIPQLYFACNHLIYTMGVLQSVIVKCFEMGNFKFILKHFVLSAIKTFKFNRNCLIVMDIKVSLYLFIFSIIFTILYLRPLSSVVESFIQCFKYFAFNENVNAKYVKDFLVLKSYCILPTGKQDNDVIIVLQRFPSEKVWH